MFRRFNLCFSVELLHRFESIAVNVDDWPRTLGWTLTRPSWQAPIASQPDDQTYGLATSHLANDRPYLTRFLDFGKDAGRPSGFAPPLTSLCMLHPSGRDAWLALEPSHLKT